MTPSKLMPPVNLERLLQDAGSVELGAPHLQDMSFLQKVAARPPSKEKNKVNKETKKTSSEHDVKEIKRQTKGSPDSGELGAPQDMSFLQKVAPEKNSVVNPKKKSMEHRAKETKKTKVFLDSGDVATPGSGIDVTAPATKRARRLPPDVPYTDRWGEIVSLEKRLQHSPDGCTRCRWVKGCTRSCWAKFNLWALDEAWAQGI